MKRKILSFVTLLATVILSTFCLVACDKEVQPVVITVSEPVTVETTLLDIMNERKTEGELQFEITNGMITSLNGTANTTNSYWMLYTSDASNANAEWGTYEYNGETLGSAVLGASALVVAQGETYVWVYQTF